jgi:hypothetical protein
MNEGGSEVEGLEKREVWTHLPGRAQVDEAVMLVKV